MNTKLVFQTLRQLTAALFICASPYLISCTGETDPQPTPGTTPPGSGTTTTPGTSTTTPGTSTTTTPGTSTTATPGVSVVPVVDYIKAKDNLTFLAAAIAQAGLTAEFNKGGLAVFAPTDDAFRAAGYASAAAVGAAPAADLQRILRYHAIGSRTDLSSIPTQVTTVYETLLANNQITVYKVSNTDVNVNNAKVVQGDIAATNSAIHIINKVLMPAAEPATAVVAKNTDLSLFNAAVTRAGASAGDILSKSSDKGVTIFAPNNAAIKAAGYADEAAIQKEDPAKLATLLKYHILNYRAFSQTFQNGAEVVTAQGGSVKFTVADGKVSIAGKNNGANAATITQADLAGTNNSVVHVIDRVLLP